MTIFKISMRSRASKISNLCKSLIAAVALFGATVSARANPNYLLVNRREAMSRSLLK
jgi:hypothetical protein